MNELLPQKASLPSLPSDFTAENRQINESEQYEFELDQLCMSCYSAFADEFDYLDYARETAKRLFPLIKNIIRHGDKIPFSLSASSLIQEVYRHDCLGPAKMGFYYGRQLYRECRFLVPHRITEKNSLAFHHTIETWNHNRFDFRCQVIGAILAIKWVHFEKRTEVNNDYADI